MEINIGDIVTLKKQHPCGSKEWEVLRVGMDFRLKCLGCEHQIMIPRKQIEKNIRGILNTLHIYLLYRGVQFQVENRL